MLKTGLATGLKHCQQQRYATGCQRKAGMQSFGLCLSKIRPAIRLIWSADSPRPTVFSKLNQRKLATGWTSMCQFKDTIVSQGQKYIKSLIVKKVQTFSKKWINCKTRNTQRTYRRGERSRRATAEVQEKLCI